MREEPDPPYGEPETGRAPAGRETATRPEDAAAALEEAVRFVTTPGAFGQRLFASTQLIDGALSRLTRRGAALQLELGHTLVELSAASHKARLNVSSIFDYARESLGLKSNRARRLFRVAEAMPRRPLLHEAVLRGTVDLCKADVVIPVALDEAEEAWVHLARTETVDRLEELVRAEGHLVPEGYRAALIGATADQRIRLEAALEVAGFTQRSRSRWIRLEALCQEYIGEYGGPESYVALPTLEARLTDFWAAAGSAPATAPAPKVERSAESVEDASADSAARGGAWAALEEAGSGPEVPAGGGPAADGQAAAADGQAAAAGGQAAAAGADVDPPAAESPGRDGAAVSAPASSSPEDPWQSAWRTDFMRHAIDIDETLAALARVVDGRPPPPPLRALGPRPSTAQLHAHAKRLATLMAGWSEQMGQLLLVVQERRLWRLLGYRSFSAYCRDRLLIEPRTARYHVKLEERLRALPVLRTALREGRLTFSKAELLARHATRETVASAVDEAEDRTLLDLHRLWEERERRQLAGEDPEGPGDMRNASETEGPADDGGREEGNASETEGPEDDGGREKGNVSETGQVKLDGPESTLQLVEDAILVARIVAWLQEGALITTGEALARVGDHFVETWRTAVPKLRGKEAILWERTGGACAVPGCTGHWQDSHHVVFRSHGGGDEVWNLHPLCRFHHNQALHGGHMRLRGRAGEYLVWELMTSLDDIVTFIETGAGENRTVRRVRDAAPRDDHDGPHAQGAGRTTDRPSGPEREAA